MYEIFVREAKLKCARVYFRAFFRACRKTKDLAKSWSPNLIQKDILLNIKRTSYGKHTNSRT